ncbi:ribonuclease Y [Candidatus Beckwithbacteria bacterium RIFCSPLOWO2_02_FULL_49_12]|nr:MAG: ribonuclease Y [Candidatus Beckwithbacteria bacterium RIFCSPLOWO2_02_FULL_49_12]
MSFFRRLHKFSSQKPYPKVVQPPVGKKPPVAPKTDLSHAQAQAREIILEAKDEALKIRTALEQKELELKDLKASQLDKLKAISRLKPDEAKKMLLSAYEKRLTRDIAEIVSEAEERAKAEADEKAKEILVEAMGHGATDYVAEYTVSIVKVKDEDMKGRVIGRDGRNIRTFEKVTGVEVDLDEPGLIRLSCFDPVRREIARVALEKLLADGRIQPSRIEEIVKRVKEDIDRIMRREGEKLAHAVKVFNLPVEIIDKLGRFKYRFSYGQNMIAHTLEETRVGIKLAHEVGANVNIVRLGCLLHDIGKVIDDAEGTHVEVGVKFLRQFRVPEAVINCVAEHHEDKPFSSTESVLVYIADAISGSRPGARYEDHEGYLTRMTQIEDIASGFTGVDTAYAIQAGREVRVVVNPKDIDDDATVKLASDIRDKIKEEVKDFPGQIKVNVIRETRAEAVT